MSRHALIPTRTGLQRAVRRAIASVDVEIDTGLLALPPARSDLDSPALVRQSVVREMIVELLPQICLRVHAASLKRGRRNRSCSTGRRRQRPSAGFSPSESARRCALRQPCRPGPSDRRSFDRAYGARAHCRIPQTWRDPPYRSGESINRGMTLREANSISRVTTLIAA